MKQWSWWTLGLVVSVIVETSLFSAPLSLWWIWQILRQKGWQTALWMGVIAGLVLDVLMVRQVGLSSLLMVSFLTGVWVLRRALSRLDHVELIWFAIFACGWSWWLNRTFWAGLIVVVWSIIFNRWFSMGSRDISLRSRRL